MRIAGVAFGSVVSLAAVGTLAAGLDLRGLALAGGRPVSGAVIWLDVPAARAAASPRRVVLDQQNLTFAPRVLAVRVGTVVDFPNNDRVFHNVFSFRDGRRFDLGMYPVGAVRSVTFDRPGLSRIFCNIHPNMAAYVWALESSYFAVSDEHGAFTIPSVPAGTYPYHAWRSAGPILTGSITLDDDLPLEIRWP
jgi:plastocyanin